MQRPRRRIMAVPAALALGTVVLFVPSAGSPGGSPRPSPPAGTGIVPLPSESATRAVARTPALPNDFNGDGRRDLVIVNNDLQNDDVTVVYSGPNGPDAQRQQRIGLPQLSHTGPAGRIWHIGDGAASADFDRDGFADLAVSAGPLGDDWTKGSGVFVIYGGARGLTERKVVLSVPGASLGQVVVGDFDGNGIADLVAFNARAYQPNSYWTFANFGGKPVQGVQTDVDRHGVGETKPVATAADFNGDGRTDLAIVSMNRLMPDNQDVELGRGQIYLGTSRGLRRGMVFGTDWPGWSLASGDVDGDGRADLVVRYVTPSDDPDPAAAYRPPGKFALLLGTADGVGAPRVYDQDSPQVPDRPHPENRFASTLAVGDVNGDGKADVVVGAPGQRLTGDSSPTGTVTLLYGAKTGLTTQNASRFDGVTSNAPDGFGRKVFLADLNGDGKADLTAATDGRTILFLPSDGASPLARDTRSYLSDSSPPYLLP